MFRLHISDTKAADVGTGQKQVRIRETILMFSLESGVRLLKVEIAEF